MKRVLRSLFRHQGWADAALLSAVHEYSIAQGDETLRKTLQHIVTVQRFFLSQFLERSFDYAAESRPVELFSELTERFRSTSAEQVAFLDGIEDADLERQFELPFLNIQVTFTDGMLQVAMHSQNHRGQCLTRLRELGAKPPTLDYVLWTKDRPAPVWPEV